jgi:hypothetical protein
MATYLRNTHLLAEVLASNNGKRLISMVNPVNG